MAEPTSPSTPPADSPTLAGAVSTGSEAVSTGTAAGTNSGAVSAGSMARTASGPASERAKAASSPATTGGLVPAEWPAQAADAIVDTIGKVRDKTTKPAVTAARGVVYGTLAGIVGLVALVLVLILLVRVLANYVPGDVWLIYAALFVVLSIAGIVLLRKANRRPATTT